MLLALVGLDGCRTGTPKASAVAGDSTAAAEQLLAGARRALGGGDRIRTIDAVAAVTGPRSSFVTRVSSARDGRARLALGPQFLAGVGAREGWLFDVAADTAGPLDPVSRSILRGHELHMLVLAPASRWRRPRAREGQTWQGRPALAVVFDDDLADPVTLYLSATDTMPVGIRLMNHTGQGLRDVDVTFDRWESLGGVRLFRKAVFAQAADSFVYDYTDLRLNAVDDSTFEPPRRR